MRERERREKMEERKRTIQLVVLIIVIVAIAVCLYFFYFRKKPAEAPPVAPVKVEKPAVIPVEKPAPTAPAMVQVSLGESDAFIREQAKGVSANARYAAWLRGKDFIRKFAAAVDNIANGLSPKPQIDFFALKDDFKVIERNGLTYADPESYKRYNQAADVFISLDAKECVKLYRQLKGPIQEAYKLLGYPNQDFHETLTKAIVELLKTPVVRGDLQLEAKVISYAIADPRLENLSDAQKHFLRMGPENVLKIQTKIREIGAELEIPANKLPRSRTYIPRS